MGSADQGTLCPSGSLSYTRHGDEIVINRSGDRLAQALLALSLVPAGVIVYSFLYAPTLIPKAWKIPLVLGTFAALVASLVWLVRTWLRRERLRINADAITYERAAFGLLRQRHRVSPSGLKEVRADYLGERGSGRVKQPYWGLLVTTEEGEFCAFADPVSFEQQKWIATRIASLLGLPEPGEPKQEA